MNLPRTPSFRLDGRRALVAGASSGIGFGAAAALAEAGAHVVMAARGEARLKDAVLAVTEAGYAAEALLLDVTDIAAMRDVLAPLGAFDVLVNSAGIARHAPALETELSNYDAVMAANVKGAHFLAVGVAHGMVEAGKGGSIMTISSQMGHVGGIDRSVYAASKHAVEGMTKSMAIEWGGHGIRVNTVCPTFIRTPLAEQTLKIPERRRWIEEKIKLGRVGEIEDVMGAVVFLASDASALITGTSLLIDGGWTAD
ncbi:MAG: SDR family oxidoreductase [Pseudomonadota bacterium]